MDCDDEISSLHVIRHFERLSEDPVYEEGYMAENHYAAPWPENPYIFPQKIADEQMMVANIDGELTEEQKNRLRELGILLEASEWARWASGNYARYCSKHLDFL